MEERVELEEEFDDSCELEVVVREFLREVLPLVHRLVGLGRQRLDSNRVELVAPQELERVKSEWQLERLLLEVEEELLSNKARISSILASFSCL